MQRLAVVIPIFNERDTLPELQRRLCAAFAAMPDVAASVVYVNDGSRDDSLAAMLRQQQDDPRFGAIDLSRNFGHQAALTAEIRQRWRLRFPGKSRDRTPDRTRLLAASG